MYEVSDQVRKLLRQPRFLVSPDFLPEDSDLVHCPHCKKKALDFLYVHFIKPGTEYDIYSCRWCKKVYRRLRHDGHTEA